MSWMTPPRAGSDSGGIAMPRSFPRHLGSEDVLDPVSRLLHADEPQTELRHQVAHDVIGGLVDDLDPQQSAASGCDAQVLVGEGLTEPVARVGATGEIL